MGEATLLYDLARTNVELYRRVTELEDQDRQRLSRIAGLKLEVERLQLERGDHGG